MPVILAIKRLRRKDCTFEFSLGYLASSRPEWAAQPKKKKLSNWRRRRKRERESKGEGEER